MDYTVIIESVITIIVAIIGGLLIPYIKKNISAATLQKVMTYITTFVQAAEQLYDADKGAEKKAYVLEKLAEAGIKVDMTILDAQIESAVLKLHKQLSDE